jgi:drug/metabolite transporter (DMT)-like permease
MSDKLTIIHASRTDYLALSALVFGAVAVGASPIFVRLSELGPFATAFYRPALAIPALMLWLRLDGRGTSGPQSVRDVLLLMSAGALFAGDLAFWHLSIHNTSVANATLFATSTPIFVAVSTWIFFRQRLTAVFLGGMATTLLGAGFLLASDLSFDPEHLKGDGYGIVAALFFASYLIAVSRLRVRFSTSAVMTWSSIGTAIILFPIALVSGEAMIAETIYGWVVLLALALISHAAGQGLIAFALAKISVHFSSVGLLIEPLSAALLAFLILGESLNTWQIAGGAIILSGIVVARRGSR